MVEHALDRLQEICAEVFLVTNQPEEFNHISANVVKDIVLDRGPMVGVLSGLLVAIFDHAFVVPCDMPLLDRKVILALASHRHEADVVLYRHDSHIEPLIGVYSKRCIHALEETLFQYNKRGREDDSSREVLRGITKKAIDFAGRLDEKKLPPHFNVDTPRDFGALFGSQRVRVLASRR